MRDLTRLIELLENMAVTEDHAGTAELYAEAAAALRGTVEQRDRIQGILDGRPAINAGLPETYIRWSQSIYVVEARDAAEVGGERITN